MIRWTLPGFNAVDLDDTIQVGDWVAECIDGDLSIGTPGVWQPANGTLGQTPRRARVFACRPVARPDQEVPGK
jgi:hypothetical protein